MAPVGDHLLEGSFVAQAGTPSAPNPVTGPTALFWMVCFALNAVAAPSTSVCGLGYEPNWVVRISPVAQLFDGLHMVMTWLIAYRTLGGSARMATSATLLGRLTGVNAPEAMRRSDIARKALSKMIWSALMVDCVILDDIILLQRLSEGDLGGQSSEVLIPPRDLEKARVITRDLIKKTETAGGHVSPILLYDARKALDQLQALEAQAREAQFLLWELTVSGDSAAQKERIRRAIDQYISDVDNVKGWVELSVAAQDVNKARSALSKLTKETFFRWFCFTIGVFPQALKLFGSSGITALQICGAAFLFPWVIFEVIIASARILGLGESDANWILKWDYDPGQRELSGVLALRIASEFKHDLLRVSENIFFPWKAFWHQQRHDRRGLGPTDSLVGYWAYSVMLGCAVILGHMIFMVYICQSGYLDKSIGATFSFLLIPVWVDDLGLLTVATRIELSEWKIALGFPGWKRTLGLSFVYFCFILSFKVPLWAIAAKDEVLVQTPPLLVFVVVSVVCRLFVVPSLSRASARSGQHLLTGLRLGLLCAPSVYYFLVLYEEEGTELLTWAEWLG